MEWHGAKKLGARRWVCWECGLCVRAQSSMYMCVWCGVGAESRLGMQNKLTGVSSFFMITRTKSRKARVSTKDKIKG